MPNLQMISNDFNDYFEDAENFFEVGKLNDFF